MKTQLHQPIETVRIVVLLILVVCVICDLISTDAFAVSTKVEVAGKVFEFDKDNDYGFSSATSYKSSAAVSTYGSFSITGTDASLVSAAKKNGVPAFTISEGCISVFYTYSDSLLNAKEDEWHLVDDKEKNIDLLKLGSNVQKGAIILQRSVDCLNWRDISVQTNAFEDTPRQFKALYETTDIEMINGCFYRLIVVYELARVIGTTTTLGLIPKDEVEYKRVAEVYEFYAITENEYTQPLDPEAERRYLGKRELVADFESYSGSKEITSSDIHYGWDLGQFFVTGFTSSPENDAEGNFIFLKNTGDVVTLWFKLNQNIDALNKDSSLSITADEDGRDQHFEIPTMDFGRGMLIIRHTDYENNPHEPIKYANFLEANTYPEANTRVQLFEEGDYEVALDYEVTKDQLIDKVHHYRIFFKFSVRNADCKLFPMDARTGAELTNGSIAKDGFYLDVAKSRYLKVTIKKEVLVEGVEGLTEDTRFNTSTTEGQTYTDEGIYTITATNRYTNLKIVKKIYVGTNPLLMAHMIYGYSINELKDLIDHGAVLYEDGTIKKPDATPLIAPTQESNEPEQNGPAAEQTTDQDHSGEVTPTEDHARTSVEEGTTTPGHNIVKIIAIAITVVVVMIIVIGAVRKHSRKETDR